MPFGAKLAAGSGVLVGDASSTLVMLSIIRPALLLALAVVCGAGGPVEMGASVEMGTTVVTAGVVGGGFGGCVAEPEGTGTEDSIDSPEGLPVAPEVGSPALISYLVLRPLDQVIAVLTWWPCGTAITRARGSNSYVRKVGRRVNVAY